MRRSLLLLLLLRLVVVRDGRGDVVPGRGRGVPRIVRGRGLGPRPRPPSSSSSSSSSASGDSSDSDSDSDSDAPEPIPKYQRLGASLPDLLADDAATCACAWEGGVLALGTASGRVRVFDSLGGELKRFASHRAGPVRAVSFDARGEFVASCSEDGTVAIRGLYVDEHQVTRAFGRAMRAVALDPDFARPSPAASSAAA